MKKLKIILNSNLPYIFLILLTILSVFISTLKTNKSIYNINDNTFILEITDYKITKDKLTLSLKGKEDLIGTYYIKDDKEYQRIIKDIKYGLKTRIKGTLNIPNNNTIPNTFNYKKYLYNKNIYYTISIDNIEILNNSNNLLIKLKNIINNRINNIDNKGYIKAFILGDKSNINKDIYSNYQSIGTTHLFAISGMHITLLSTIILKLLHKLKDISKYTILNIFLVLYGYIVNYPSSIKRCITFFILNTINKLLKLNISSIKILIITACILIICNPKIIYDTSFLYSFSTVVGILLYQGYIKDDNKLLSSLKLSIIAFTFSLPITLSSFYSINFLSILYNILYIPFISIIVYPLSLLTFIVPSFTPILNICILILEESSKYLSNINILTIYLSVNTIEIFIYYIILIIFIKLKKKYILLILPSILIINLLIPYIDPNAYIYFFDVSQGDSSLIITPYKKDIILIDTGGIPSKNSNYKVTDNIITFLKSKSIKTIDYLILSHGDYDHMGESTNLIDNLSIKQVIFNCGSFNTLEKNLIKVLNDKNIKYNSCIKELNTNNKLYFLQTNKYNNENDNSLVFYTSIYNHKFLFTGDASQEVEQNIINKYNIQDIDVLKVGHHGSKTSSKRQFINKINPKYSIISLGKNNRFNHPNIETLNTLKDSKIFRTDQDGSIVFTINKNKLKIETFNP